MTGEPVVSPRAHDADAIPGGEYDILVLDASLKQSLACARSLGRAGLRVALGEAASQHRLNPPLPAFESRYCARALVLPDYADDPEQYASAVIGFVREHPTRVVLPAGDATCITLMPRREELAALGATLALPPDSAMDLALHKDRTLKIARELGIAYPASMPVHTVEDLPAAASELGYPMVIKPTSSWTGKSAARIVPAEVIDKEESVAQAEFLFARGAEVIAQQWACGRREGVTLFMANGEIVAACGHVEHRTTPLLGGVSVVRESMAAPDDIYTPAVRLAKAMGLEGLCEVEFRRDATGHPLLMEINPRIPGTLENSIRAGVNFPLLIWQWATGQPVDRVEVHRSGVRTRWLHGDIRWLRDNFEQTGRPDGMPRTKAALTFAAEFFRTRHYDYFDRHDLRPALAEMRYTASVLRKSRSHASCPSPE
jgi:predicted ATP-grasp superfamily ATP-dependent carboligase